MVTDASKLILHQRPPESEDADQTAYTTKVEAFR